MRGIFSNGFPVLDVAHLVEAGAAEVLTEQQVLELSLIALVDLEPVGVEEADVGAALVERRDEYVNSRGAPVEAGRELGDRHRQLAHVAGLCSGAHDAGDDRALDHPRRARVILPDHDAGALGQGRAVRGPETRAELRGQLHVDEPTKTV